VVKGGEKSPTKREKVRRKKKKKITGGRRGSVFLPVHFDAPALASVFVA